jgi:hypothetical protein
LEQQKEQHYLQIFFRYLLAPIGIALGIRNTRVKAPASNEILEAAYCKSSHQLANNNVSMIINEKPNLAHLGCVQFLKIQFG